MLGFPQKLRLPRNPELWVWQIERNPIYKGREKDPIQNSDKLYMINADNQEFY